MREAVLAMRAIWDAWQNRTKLNFKGEFYRFDLMTPFFNPGPIAHPRIPVYIAGVNATMCRIAGEVPQRHILRPVPVEIGEARLHHCVLSSSTRRASSDATSMSRFSSGPRWSVFATATG